MLLVSLLVIIMSYNYQESLCSESLSRYNQKLNLISLKQCPYQLPAGVWENNPCKWPDLQWGDVYSYLIDSPGVFTRESMKAYKSLEAHIFFTSGWVQTVLHYRSPASSHIILKADVRPSQRVNDTPHHPWVALSTDGSVSAAHCDCMAGLSEACSHVAAVLFKIEAAVRLGYTKKSCTEEPCKWNADFIKKVQPAPIAKIKFYKASAIEKAKNRQRKTTKKYQPATAAEKDQLLQALQSCSSKPVVLSTFSGYSDPFTCKRPALPCTKIPPPLNTLYNIDNTKLAVDELYQKCVQIRDSITMAKESRKYIYDSTKSQSSSLTWFEQRIGRISSSTVHHVMHTSVEKPSKSLILRICNPSTVPLKTPSIVWGRDNEPRALQEYKQVMGDYHKNMTVNTTGFLIDDIYPYLGASSDSIVNCDCHGKIVVEVKCPYRHRDSSYGDFIGDKDCFIHEQNKLRPTHQYYSQVQMQMYIHKADMCHFCVWGKHFLVICEVQKDPMFIKDMLDRCHDFFTNCISPELLTRKLQYSDTLSVPLSNSPEKLYCVCQSPEDGEMIGCDNPLCKFKWFHLDCIKMKKVPKGNWLCKFCKK